MLLSTENGSENAKAGSLASEMGEVVLDLELKDVGDEGTGEVDGEWRGERRFRCAEGGSSGGVGASELRLERERTFSKPILLNGSGSNGRSSFKSSFVGGSMAVPISGSLNVTRGACFVAFFLFPSPMTNSSMSGVESASSIITSFSDAV